MRTRSGAERWGGGCDRVQAGSEDPGAGAAKAGYRAVGNCRFGKQLRLLTPREYRAVFDRVDARAASGNLLLLARRNGLERHRLGLIIAKKQVPRAVDRNRIKRMAREVFRHCPPSRAGLDVIVLARRGLERMDKRALSAILRKQWQALTETACAP